MLVVGGRRVPPILALGGYGRDTTPPAQTTGPRGDLVYFSNVSSCGTNTQTSVPCVFLAPGRETLTVATHQENLLDVLQRAGLADAVAGQPVGLQGRLRPRSHADTRNLNLPDICPEGECFDEAMLRALPDELARLDPERRARGTVVVMHQMGSHGPAYYKRSPPAMKLFQPECTSHALQECPRNRSRTPMTTRCAIPTTCWPKPCAGCRPAAPTALVYVSDHGESLGEKGLYLHGMPYRMAPTEQTHVPMLTLGLKPLQQAQGLRLDCLRTQAAQPWSHDNLFHTMLGLARVGTTARDGTLDMLAPCTGPS